MQAFFPFRQATNLVSIRERLVAHFGNIRVTDRPDPVSLKRALRAIHACFGQINFGFLGRYSVDQALNCLKQIHEVGPKIAAAISLSCIGK